MSTQTATEPRTIVSCACDTCRVNAKKVGASFPLSASVLSRHLEGRKITKSLTHNFARDAHDPGMIGQGVRRATGLLPA